MIVINSKFKNIAYFILFILVIGFDRLTKSRALDLGYSEKVINKFLSFNLAYNRGVSWGLFNSCSSLVFFIISLVTIAVTLSVIIYAISRYKLNYNIYGEILVISGAISNIIDRFYYNGVVDFILLKYGNYSWPLFNIADVVIVLGVIILIFSYSDTSLNSRVYE